MFQPFKGRSLGRLSTLIACSAFAVVIGCGGPPPRSPKLPPVVDSSSLGPGDILEVLVYDEPSMSKPFKVAPNGTIDFPLVGNVEVEGKEAQEVADLLKTRLRDGRFLKNPSVSVLVKEVNSKKFSVFGQVQKPGQFPMNEGVTLLQAISIAGGFTTIADRDRVTLNRRISKAKVIRVVVSVAAMTEGKIDDIRLQTGDSIYVEERIF